MTNILDELEAYNLRHDPRVREDPRKRFDVRAATEGARVPLGGNRMQLTTEEKAGYHRHWINDVSDRIERALRGGYRFIPKDGIGKVGTGSEPGHTDLGSVVSKVVGTQANGQPLRAYRMEIPIEYYEQDQAAKLAPVRQNEADMRRGIVSAQEGDTSHRYVPEEGIHIGDK